MSAIFTYNAVIGNNSNNTFGSCFPNKTAYFNEYIMLFLPKDYHDLLGLQHKYKVFHDVLIYYIDNLAKLCLHKYNIRIIIDKRNDRRIMKEFIDELIVKSVDVLEDKRIEIRTKFANGDQIDPIKDLKEREEFLKAQITKAAIENCKSTISELTQVIELHKKNNISLEEKYSQLTTEFDTLSKRYAELLSQVSQLGQIKKVRKPKKMILPEDTKSTVSDEPTVEHEPEREREPEPEVEITPMLIEDDLPKKKKKVKKPIIVEPTEEDSVNLYLND